jgi:hypothetical protein
MSERDWRGNPEGFAEGRCSKGWVEPTQPTKRKAAAGSGQRPDCATKPVRQGRRSWQLRAHLRRSDRSRGHLWAAEARARSTGVPAAGRRVDGGGPDGGPRQGSARLPRPTLTLSLAAARGGRRAILWRWTSTSAARRGAAVAQAWTNCPPHAFQRRSSAPASPPERGFTPKRIAPPRMPVSYW